MKTISTLVLGCAAFVSACRGVVTDRPVQPDPTIMSGSPGSSYIWIGDSWSWDNQSQLYIFQQGRWTQPKKSNAIWVDGYWKQTRGGWKYVRGYWKH